MKSRFATVDDHGETYKALVFWCPGCERIDSQGERQAGLHMLPIEGDSSKRPTWDFSVTLRKPTLSPSILSKIGFTPPFVCHSFLKDGVFTFLSDCTHKYKDQSVPIPDLPAWAENDYEEREHE
jgi:hypothetical protein